MKIWLIFLLGGLAVACNSLENSTHTSAPANDLRIAFNVLLHSETADYEVFSMALDGSDRRNLTNHPGLDWVYYAYNEKIYFISDRDTCRRCYFLYEMDSDGKNVRKIYSQRLNDSWIDSRKDNSEFIVQTQTDDIRTFLLIDREGNELQEVLKTNDFPFNDASFSPDGRQVAYRSKESGADELWIIDLETGNRNQLTHYPIGGSTRHEHQYHAGPPYWVSTHNLISFISDRNGNYSIFTILPDGSAEQQLTPDGFDEGWHSWSPDGVLITYDGTPLDSASYDIFLMNADGSNVRRLTTDTLTEQAPVFVRPVSR